MPVIHRSPAPVLLIGHANSGTSILSRLLREYLAISFGTESQFIVRYFRNLAAYGDLEHDANLRALIGDLLGERWFARCHEKWGFAPDADALFHSVRERNLRSVLDAVFLALAAHNGLPPRWGDKTPDYAFDLDVLGELFPDGKFIHLVRDGRDVALSVMDRPWGPNNVFTAAAHWKKVVSLIDDFASSLPADQLVTVSYEELLTQPVATMERLIEFLEIDDQDGGLHARIRQELPRDLIAGNCRKWKTRMTPAQQRRFETVAGRELHRHGYETQAAARSHAPTFAEEVYWRFDDRVRKYASPGYWQDNAYKLRLRTRDALRNLRSGITPAVAEVAKTSAE